MALGNQMNTKNTKAYKYLHETQDRVTVVTGNRCNCGSQTFIATAICEWESFDLNPRAKPTYGQVTAEVCEGCDKIIESYDEAGIEQCY